MKLKKWCGTCKNNNDNENNKKEKEIKCEICLATTALSNGEEMFSQWEDALPCCKNEKVEE